MDYYRQFKVQPGTKVRLDKIDAGYKGKHESHAAAQPEIEKHQVRILTMCKLNGRTGVEMEALTAASAAALTLYDMCKAVDRGMVIESVCVLEKKGGKSGHWVVEPEN